MTTRSRPSIPPTTAGDRDEQGAVMNRAHAMPFGATVGKDGAVRFRLWAPDARAVDLKLTGGGRPRLLPMTASGEFGWFEVTVNDAGAGDRYVYVIDGAAEVPDPASRFQPDGVHGPSMVIDPAAFSWSDAAWRGRPFEEAVFYELHVGTVTGEGTFDGMRRHLDSLSDLGVTAIELMPVAEAPGRWNWGYDGVYPFAPQARYGGPDRLKALVCAAHARGLMVFLDVVLNHFGPEGNYLRRYASPFFTERHQTPWGAAINYDGEHSRTVRDFFIEVARYWIEEFNLDGLRIDAVHAIFDDGEPHILEELADAASAVVPPGRHVHLVLENDDNAAGFLRRAAHGAPRWYAAQWNDDLHHALHVLATGEREGYFADYAADPVADLGRALAEGFVYQGQRSAYRGGVRRGGPSAHLPPTAFVGFLQNHDQIGNRALGERIGDLVTPDALRAVTAILLLAPAPPLLFMGQEWATSAPFPFFCDFGPDLADSVRQGRLREFSRFPEFADPAARERIPDPLSEQTVRRATLDWAERDRSPHREWLDFHDRLLTLRRGEIVPLVKDLAVGRARYRLLGEGASNGQALAVEWRLIDGRRLSLLANPSARPAEISGGVRASGRKIYATHGDGVMLGAPRKLPPWFVSWSVEGEGEDGHG